MLILRTVATTVPTITSWRCRALHSIPRPLAVSWPLKPFASRLRLTLCMLKPIDKERWNYTLAAHLLNRAGFGGTPAEIEHLAGLSPEQAVLSLVEYGKTPDPTPNPEWAKPDPTRADRF